MLDIHQDTDDSDSIEHNLHSPSRYDLNISRALALVLHDDNVDGINFINVIRVVIGHRVLLSHGGKGKIKQVISDEEEKELTEDEEIDEFLKEIK